ncbi:hypothetical protein HYU92_04360 [Candidatus Curtissbacteria bacterium]|nr:hypothetical protein [Candidatus Curtissbacteria bacterium]
MEGGERITIERITNPGDPRIDQIQALLAAEFKEAEVDPPKVMRAAIQGKDNVTGSEVPTYIVIAVQNENDKVVGAACGAVLEKKNEDYNPIGNEAVILGAYITMEDEYRRLGAGTLAFNLRMAEAQAEAARKGLKPVAYIAEVVDNSEAFINSQGGFRLYSKENDGNYKEVPYLQPPLEYDKNTGRPTARAGTVPEHLMVKMFDGSTTIKGETLLEMVRAMFDYNNYREEGYFNNKRAFNQHSRIISNIEEELTEAVSGKTLHMISRADRENLASQGITFADHTTNS